jgi:hypothetical protein
MPSLQLRRGRRFDPEGPRGGRIMNLVGATEVKRRRPPEILGVELITTEDGRLDRLSPWIGGPGLSGVVLVVPTPATAVVDVVASMLPGATRQRRRVHSAQQAHRVPKTAQSMVGAFIQSIFEQPNAEQVYAQPVGSRRPNEVESASVHVLAKRPPLILTRSTIPCCSGQAGITVLGSPPHRPVSCQARAATGFGNRLSLPLRFARLLSLSL